MKRIEAVIRPESLEGVKQALSVLGRHGITVYEARGHGVQGGLTQQWSEGPSVVDLLPKTVVVLVVHDHEVQPVVAAIVEAARCDRPGDGKIFVTPVEEVMRVRTGETGPEAM